MSLDRTRSGAIEGRVGVDALDKLPSIQLVADARRSAQSLARVYACPHCSALSIGFWRKERASLLKPATCPLCLGRSVPSWPSGLIGGILHVVVFWGSIALAAAMRNPRYLLLIPIGVAGLSWALNQFFPLVPAGGTAHKIAKWFFWLLLVLVFLAVIGNLIHAS